MADVQLIYISRPFGFDAPSLAGVLIVARANNLRDGITGCLICRADIYVQLLEGPEAAVAVTWAKIRRDDRHANVERKVFRPITERMFPNWAMRDDPAQSWLWNQAEVDAGAADNATEADMIAIFDRVAQSAA